jgi:hypothetical protein
MLLVGIVQGVRCFRLIGLVSGPQTFPLAVAFHDTIRVVVGLRRTPALHQTAELASTILQPPLRSSNQSYFS